MKKKQHKPLFIDEKDFTLNAVIPWLRQNSTFENVTYVGGTEEFGRDVIFSRQEAGGVKSWMAVQVKDDDIKGTQTSAGIREIINQAKSAMENPFSLQGSRETHLINGVYIVTLGKITSNASTIIKNSSELQGRTIHFFDGDKIISDLKWNKAFVSRVKILIRSKQRLEKVKLETNKILNNLDVKFYNHVPDENDFETEGFADISLDFTIQELSTHKDKIGQIIKQLSVVSAAVITLYYSKAYSKKQLELATNRFLKKWSFMVTEREGCPCLLYDCLNSNDEWGWTKDVDNLQILQEN